MNPVLSDAAPGTSLMYVPCVARVSPISVASAERAAPWKAGRPGTRRTTVTSLIVPPDSVTSTCTGPRKVGTTFPATSTVATACGALCAAGLGVWLPAA